MSAKDALQLLHTPRRFQAKIYHNAQSLLSARSDFEQSAAPDSHSVQTRCMPESRQEESRQEYQSVLAEKLPVSTHLVYSLARLRFMRVSCLSPPEHSEVRGSTPLLYADSCSLNVHSPGT